MKSRIQKQVFILLVFAGFVLLLSACQKNPTTGQNQNTLTPTEVEPTPQPTVEPKTLVVCLGEEPQSLYLYGGSTQAMWSVLEAVYDGPIDTTNYIPEPVILDELPSQENGGIVISAVDVKEGDIVANIEGDPVALKKGTKVFPEGCTSPTCAVEWDGTSELKIVQMSAAFTILPGINWSDGQPLTADDSVFSYEISADKASNVSKNSIQRTASYEAVDTQTVRWTGIPGYLTMNASTLFWIPLPRHQLGELSAEELNTSDLTNKSPLGWGAYQVDEWVAGDHIRMVRNPNYFRTAEVNPYFDVVVYRFLSAMPEADLSPIVTGECDILDPSVNLNSQIQSVRELELAGKLKSYFSTTSSWEVINLGIKPSTYDEVYNPYLDRQDFFGDVRVRQAFAYCTDREKINKDLLFSQSQVAGSYMPIGHPFNVTDLTSYPYDPAKGIELLEQVGWMDSDGDVNTPRVASGVPNVFNGQEFSIKYELSDTPLHRDVAKIVTGSLQACGISVTAEFISPADLVSSGPDGMLFGRNFDLAELAWSAGNTPPCFLYATSEIPTEKNAWLGTKYGGVNITGYSNPAYDAACSNLLSAGLDRELFASANQETQKIISDDLPVIPLFYQVKLMASRTDLCGLSLDASSRSPMSSVESLSIGESCASN